MAWKPLYQLRRYVQSSLWVVPFVAIPFELMATRLVHRLDAWLGWPFLAIAVPGAQATLQAIVTATLSFIVFTFGSLLITIQVASAQLTPRVIATTLLRDNTIRLVVALFVLSFAFDLGVAARTENEVPYLLVTVALVLSITSIAAFLYLIDYAARLLRPVSIVWRVGEAGLAVIEDVY